MEKLFKDLSHESDIDCTYDEVDWDEYLNSTAEEDGLNVFEALSASGLRSIRYFKEVSIIIIPISDYFYDFFHFLD